MRARTVIMALAATLLLSGCIRDRLLPAFVGKDGVRLEIAGVPQFVYEENGCQMAFNAEKREFRAHTDNMSDYFCVTLNAIPVQEGETVMGDLRWTTSTSINSRNRIALEAVKVEGDEIWLWNRQSQTALVIRVLE